MVTSAIIRHSLSVSHALKPHVACGAPFLAACRHGSTFSQRRFISKLVHRIYAPKNYQQAGFLKDLVWKRLRDASRDKLQLVNGHSEAQEVEYSEVLERLGHGQFLKKLDESPNDDPTYRISDIHGIKTPEQSEEERLRKPISFRMAGRGKEFHLNSTYSVPAYKLALTSAFDHINDGCRVEMYLQVGKSERKKMGFDFMMARNPHLRPETILKSMPEGTKMLYEPLFDTECQHLVWVMSDEQKWSGKTKHTGWKGSATSPANPGAVKILSQLPVVEDHSNPQEESCNWPELPTPSSEKSLEGG